MNGEKININHIKLLTKICKETGKLYLRRSEVTAQIIETLEVSGNQLKETLCNLKSETLVFLFREKVQTDYEITGEIWQILSKRIFQIAKRQISYFTNEADFEDFIGDIYVKFFAKALELESNEADYAQVSFGEFIKGFILNELRKKQIVKTRDNQTVWLDENFEEDEKQSFELSVKFTDAEKNMVFRQALKQLPQEILEVCYLHYLEGIQIDSKDPKKITIAKIFGKNERTIRLWLKKAGEILADYKGELR